MDVSENKRGSNFSSFEVELLMSLVKKYKTVVENKKTNAVTWKEKQSTWDKIASEFNASSGNCIRTTRNIRCKYENLKKIAKKKFAAEKRETYRTGGGSAAPVGITSTDIAVKEIVGVGVEGLVNMFDSDSSVMIEIVNEDDDGLENTAEENMKISDWSSWGPSKLKKPKATPLLPFDETVRYNDVINDKYAQTQRSEQLLENEEEECEAVLDNENHASELLHNENHTLNSSRQIGKYA